MSSHPVSLLRTIALALAFGAALAACSSAETRGPGGVPIEGISFERFDAADSDHDGKLDPKEVDTAFPELSRYFPRLDSDKSGYLSWAEMKFFAPRKRR